MQTARARARAHCAFLKHFTRHTFGARYLTVCCIQALSHGSDARSAGKPSIESIIKGEEKKKRINISLSSSTRFLSFHRKIVNTLSVTKSLPRRCVSCQLRLSVKPSNDRSKRNVVALSQRQSNNIRSHLFALTNVNVNVRFVNVSKKRLRDLWFTFKVCFTGKGNRRGTVGKNR